MSMNVNTYYNLCHSATSLRWLTDLITRSACLQSQTGQHILAGNTYDLCQIVAGQSDVCLQSCFSRNLVDFITVDNNSCLGNNVFQFHIHDIG